MRMNTTLVIAVVTLCCSLSASVVGMSEVDDRQPSVKQVDLSELASIEYSYTPAVNAEARSSDASSEPSPTVAPASLDRAEPFGREGSLRLNIHGGYGRDFKTSDNQHGMLGAGISYFIIENLSLDAELNGLYIDQRGSNALAGNVNLLFRWHFFSQETWSIYLDGGAGLFYASKRVPQDGTRFNFTPQAGGGVSFEIAQDLRMMLGVRWHHISNARTSSNNPGRDSVMGYVGVSLPF